MLRASGGWGGTIADVLEIRCDGNTEVAYEDAGIRLYGGDEWWDIMEPGADPSSNLDKHNNGDTSMTPSRQRHNPLSRNKRDAIYLPDS